MKPEYLPKTFRGKLMRLAEESAELSQALLKTLRISEKVGIKKALIGYNPELPESEREANIDWIKREMADVLHALGIVQEEKLFNYCISGTIQCSYNALQVFKCGRCKKTVCWCQGGGEDNLCADCFTLQEKKRASRVRKKSPRSKSRQTTTQRRTGRTGIPRARSAR